jgi:signal transduction histidine kinase
MVDGLVDDAEAARRMAREIHASSTLMLMMRLVDDLLDTSRWVAGHIELQAGPVDLAGWLQRTAPARPRRPIRATPS